MSTPPGTGPTGADARLRELAREVTVAVLSAPAPDGEFWGSGLLVAPQWVLTCAHVLVRRDGLGRRRWAADGGVGVRIGERLVPGTAVYAMPSPRAVTQGWDLGDEREYELFPDLALIRLTEPVAHGCAWLSDRAVPPCGHRVAALGWRRTPEGLWSWDGTCRIVGNDGTHVFRLGPDSEIPAGVSGSLVVDLAHGRVVGVVKARRRNRDGGKAVRLTALRALVESEPLDPRLALGPDPYQDLVRAHDRWHYAQQRAWRDVRSTWIDVQGQLSSVMGEWTPYDRAEALGLLAELPPPRSTGVVQRLVERVLGPGSVRDPLPAAWRDGHGLLYEPESGKQLLAFVTYLLLVAQEVREQDPAAAQEVRRFAKRRAIALPAADRGRLAALEPAQAPAGVPGPAGSVLVALAPVVWRDGRPLRFRWEIQLARPGGARQLTTVCDRREGVAFEEAVAQVQEPLALALDRADESGRPAAVEVALPVHHFDTGAQWWVPDDGLPGRPHRPARPMGTRRPVVVRDVERVPPTPEWRERWDAVVRAPRLTALPLPPAGRGPGYARLRNALADAVPVCCAPVGRGDGLETMIDVLDAGHGIALWYGAAHPPHACGEHCAPLRRSVDELLAGAGAAGLPEAVRALRARAYDAATRAAGDAGPPTASPAAAAASGGAGVPAAGAGAADGVPHRGGRPWCGADDAWPAAWAGHLILLYDDARAPLPGFGAGPVEAEGPVVARQWTRPRAEH